MKIILATALLEPHLAALSIGIIFVGIIVRLTDNHSIVRHAPVPQRGTEIRTVPILGTLSASKNRNFE